MITELTGASGRFPEMSTHLWPPSVVLKTWPGSFGVAALKPLYARYAVR